MAIIARVDSFVATVEGEGVFPLDMLRSDRCYPYRQEDVQAMLSRERRTVRVVTMRMHGGPPAFNPARWKSFGWEVVRVLPIAK